MTGAYKCDQCDNGYGLLENGSCGICAPNCTTFGCEVNGAWKCDRCDLGFNLTSTNTYTPICSPNCDVSAGCNSPNTCIKCNFGYEREPSGICQGYVNISANKMALGNVIGATMDTD